MGIIINLDDATERMQPGENITFGGLDFIANQFRDLHPQEPELPVEEENSLPRPVRSSLDWNKLWMFGPALLPNISTATDMTSSPSSAKRTISRPPSDFGQIQIGPPQSDLQLPPDHFLPGFSAKLRKAAATYSNWLQQALEEPAKPHIDDHPVYSSHSPECFDNFVT
jgi:hypothetical protein